MTQKIPRFSVEWVADCDPVVGLWLAVLDDARDRMLYALKSVQEADLDRTPSVGINTIGMILYHVALTDLNWVYDNLLKEPYPADIGALFPHPLTDADDNLYPVQGWGMQDYLDRMAAARIKVHQVFKAMSLETFRALVLREESYGTYEMTPESILRHLAQHESEHRGEIQLFVGSYRQTE